MVFVDECIFTSNTKKIMGFAKVHNHCFDPHHKKLLPVVHMVAAVSSQSGLEGFRLYNGSVKSSNFIEIL